MRPTLFYIPSQIFGVPLFGIGLFFGLILAIFVGAVVSRYVKRRTCRDLGSYCSLTAVALLIVVVIMPRLAESQGFPVRGYGVFLMVAIVSSVALVIWRGKSKWNLSPDTIISVAGVAVISGILGARLFFVVEYWDSVVADSCWGTFCNVFNMTTGGLVVYGSIIGGILGILVFLLIRKLPVLGTLDLFAPGLMLGIAIGRLGCLMNGCCFGAVCDCTAGITFPVGSPAHVHQLETGEAALAGFVLKAAESEHDGSTIFSLKRAPRSLWTDKPGPAIIASVTDGSPAAQAGMKAGMIVRQVGYAGNLDGVDDTTQRQLQLIDIRGNGDLFHFLYSAMMNAPKQKILFVCSASNEGREQVERFVFVPDYATARPVWPSQIISSLAAFLLCLVLLAIDRVCKRDGFLFASMLLLYAVCRFLLELVRTDEASFCGTGLSVSQCISVAVAVVALVVFGYILSRPPIQAYADCPCESSAGKGV